MKGGGERWKKDMGRKENGGRKRKGRRILLLEKEEGD